MTVGRVLGATVATATVAGCALVVIGMARAGAHDVTARPGRAAHIAALPAHTVIPAQLPGASTTRTRVPAAAVRPASSTGTRASALAVSSAISSAVSSTGVTGSTTAAAAPSRRVRAVTVAAPAPATSTSSAVTATAPTPTPKPTANPTPTATTTPAPKPTTATTASHAAAAPARTQSSSVQRGGRLPLRMYTGSATRVITVVATSKYHTTARLQAWRKAAGGGWLRVGSATLAHIGSDGMSSSPSEYRSATPIGSFTLTQAFGYQSNPGTRLHYFRTDSADWWISQSGPLYNTHQHCWSNCAFNQGSPNEHLYYERPFYAHAVVIDYNTRNSPTGVRQGAGSAFFLHVTDGNATAGCVAIGPRKLVSIMRWLRPAAHPRILIGVS